MAKLYKVEMYVYDVNDEFYNMKEIIGDIEMRLDSIYIHAFHVEEREFEWEDDLAINMYMAKEEDFKAYFEDNSEKSNIYPIMGTAYDILH